MKKSPFKFLDSYSKEDRNIFFGRDKEIEELHSRIFQSRILVVYGVSGTGKSSLINCGLANKFNDSDWMPVSIRRGININQSLKENLVKNSRAAETDKPNRDTLRLIRSVYLDHFKPVFLIFDQFEEVFIFGTKPERDEFIATVKRITESDLQCRFIFSVREEYLAGFTEFEKVIPSFLDNRIRIEKMTRQNAIKVIEGPCLVNDITIEPGLSLRILEKLNPESPDVELTYLQVYLDKIFRIAAEEDSDVKKITGNHYLKVGDVKDLLGTFLEEQIAQLDDPDSGLIILKSFVSVKGTKHQITETEVIEYSRTLGKEINADSVKDLIQKFIALRILRDKDEHGRFELRHDSIASAIYEKITLVEKELLEVRQFIENSWNNFERRNLYLTAADLEYIAPYQDKLFLNEKLTRFITQSKRIIHKTRRRRQNAAILAVAIIISILSFFTIWAVKERKNALKQQQIAEEQKNAAIRALSVADSARKDALMSKDLALKNEGVARSAQEQSEIARKDALAQKEIALLQKNLAEKSSLRAGEQAQIAGEEKQRAEQERKKAVEAESTAKKLEMLATAQNLALTSISMEKDPGLMGTLAVKAYDYNNDNGGQLNDPVIFEALTNAWIKLDSSRHTLFRGSENEIWGIGYDQGLVTADLSGNIKKWNETGGVTSESKIAHVSPINFITLDKSGKNIVTQYDDLGIILWKYNQNGISEYEKINIERGYIKAVAFDNDEDLVAISTSDSTITIRKILPGTTEKIVTFVTKSSIGCLSFCNSDTLFYADDKSINLWNRNGVSRIYELPESKILSLSWNGKHRTLLAGCLDGSILVFKLMNGALNVQGKFNVHESGVEIMVFNSDCALLASASRNKTIRLYFYDEFFGNGNIAGGSVLIKDLSGRVRSLSFSPDNRLFAGLSDRMIRVWETASEKLSSEIKNILEKDTRISETQQEQIILP